MDLTERAPTLTLKQRVGRLVFPRLPITRFLFDQLRVEANAGLAWLANGLFPWRRRRLAALRRRRDLRANVACGPQVLTDFVNLDLFACRPEVISWDCRRSLPLGDGAAIGIRVEQFVEHLETREELPDFLRECHRALRPGGVLRIIVPDAERYLQAYCRGDLSGFRELAVPDPFPEDLPTRMDIINHVFLPPKLPQKDDSDAAKSAALIEECLGALMLFQTHIPEEERPEWTPCIKMLRKMIELRDQDGGLLTESVGSILEQMSDGGIER